MGLLYLYLYLTLNIVIYSANNTTYIGDQYWNWKLRQHASVHWTIIRPNTKHSTGTFSECAHYGIPYCLQIILTLKCTLLRALRLCTGRTAHRGSRGIALLFHDHGTRRGWGVSFTPRPLFTPRKDPVPIVQEAGWAPGPVWTGAKNLAPTGIRSPDCPARSQSLYRMSYPAPYWH